MRQWINVINFFCYGAIVNLLLQIGVGLVEPSKFTILCGLICSGTLFGFCIMLEFRCDKLRNEIFDVSINGTGMAAALAMIAEGDGDGADRVRMAFERINGMTHLEVDVYLANDTDHMCALFKGADGA